MGWVEIIVVILLPILVALVTKEVTSSAVKAVVLAALTSVAAIGQAYIDKNGILTEAVFQDAVRNFVVAVAMYAGLLKPTGVTSVVATKTSEFGI